MPNALSATSLSRASRVDPRLVAVAAAACPISKVDFGIAQEQTRTLAEQKALVARGVSRTLESKHLPQASGHSEALDLVPWVKKADGSFDWDHDAWSNFYELAAAMQVAAIQLNLPLTWGGVFDRRLADLPPGAEGMRAAVAAYVARRKKLRPGKSVFIDGPHFEIAKGI